MMFIWRQRNGHVPQPPRQHLTFGFAVCNQLVAPNFVPEGVTRTRCFAHDTATRAVYVSNWVRTMYRHLCGLCIVTRAGTFLEFRSDCGHFPWASSYSLR